MKIKNVSFLIIGMCLLAACTREVTTLQIIRHPLIRFNYDPSLSWQADNYYFTGSSRVVVYPSDTSLQGKLYNRFTLEAFGKDNNGNNLQLIMAFDAADSSKLNGVYTPAHNAQRGLNQVQVFNLNSNNLAAYELCSTGNSYLQIQKQSSTERLITGTFQMVLCNTRDTTKKINITNGILTDVQY